MVGKFTILLVLFSSLLTEILSIENEKASKEVIAEPTNSSKIDIEEMEANLDTINKAKLIGCIHLARARLNQTKEAMDEIIELAGSDKVISTLLINCYSKISIEKATDFVSGDDNLHIDSLLPENVDLLDLEKWTEIYRKKDKALTLAEMEKMKEAADSFFNTQNVLRKESDEDDKKNGINREVNAEQNKEQNKQQNKEESIPKDKPKKQGLLNFLGYNLAELDPMFKNLIGYGFIFIIIVLFSLGLKALMPKKDVVESKKKKKNQINFKVITNSFNDIYLIFH